MGSLTNGSQQWGSQLQAYKPLTLPWTMDAFLQLSSTRVEIKNPTTHTWSYSQSSQPTMYLCFGQLLYASVSQWNLDTIQLFCLSNRAWSSLIHTWNYYCTDTVNWHPSASFFITFQMRQRLAYSVQTYYRQSGKVIFNWSLQSISLIFPC